MVRFARLTLAGAALICVICPLAIAAEPAAPRPNIVWIVSEDHGPHLGCYGDAQADTPNVDRLATRGMMFAHAWSCAPVCAPARTTLISGLYATSLGAEHMRSMVSYPRDKEMFPQFLREAGYYCTNNAKEDYNVEKPGTVWDDSSNRAHWKNRAPGQPFFAVFNSEKSHEGRLRIAGPTRHDPADVRVPAYHPDTPEVRRDWARYYDNVSEADADAGKRLEELAEAGLSDTTIVFYFADHGSGMPRNKRWPANAGLQVPLVVYIPDAWARLRPLDYRAGGRSQRLVSFVDFAPTLLSLAGIEPPDWMQGRAFLGTHIVPPRAYLFGFRGRMDERYDLVRSATDGRFVYLRNYMPQRIYGQHVSYMFQTATTQVWQRLHAEGQLNAAQDAFWNTKPPEELYDLTADPDEVRNLADSAEHRPHLERFRLAVHDWILEVRDLGFPEGEIHSRARGAAPYDFARDRDRYPLERILATAELASSARPDVVPELQRAAHDPDGSVRYWAVSGLLMRKEQGVHAAHTELMAALDDPSPDVRIVAAEALGRFGDGPDDLKASLATLATLSDSSKSDVFVAMAALNALDTLGEPAAEVRDKLRRAGKHPAVPHPRYAEYVPRLLSPNER